MTNTEFKALRRKHRITLVEVANITGLGQDILARYEMGKIQLPTESLEMLADAVRQYPRWQYYLK